MEGEKIKTLFDRQKSYFVSRVHNSGTKERIEKLQRLRKWIVQKQDDIRAALYRDLRKPEVEADMTDIKPVLWEIDNTCKNLKKWMKPVKVPASLALAGTRSYILQEPLGVVLILAPWNFPFNLTVGPLVSAIAAGNCAIIKPSEYSAATSALIEAMVQELFAEEEVAVCTGDYHEAEGLLKLPFNHIFFTGSTDVGKKVMKAAAEHLSSVTLELGGMNPAILDATADLKDAARKLLFGKFLNAGQSCLSVNYLLIHQSIHERFISILLGEYEKLRFDKHDFSHIISSRHFQRLRSLIEQTVSGGAEVVVGGTMIEEDNYIAPVILNNVPYDAPVMEQEIFGPVLPVIPYKDLKDALKFIGSRHKPLALYVFSGSEKTIKHVIKNSTAGTTCVNDTTLQFIHPHLPFGGVNESGIGKSHGYAGFLAFSNGRSIVRQRVGYTTFQLIYPPYTARVKKMARWIMKYL